MAKEKKEKKEKKGGKLKWIIIIVVALFIIAALAGGDDEVKKVNTNDSQSTASASDQGDDASETNSTSGDDEEGELIFTVGETAEYKNIQITLLDVSESTGSEMNEPEDGNIYVLADFEIANNSEEELNVSSLMMFDAYVDGYATSLSFSAEGESNNETLDGTVASGKKMKGTIGYEVPEDYKELEINISVDEWSDTKIKFVYNK